MGWCPLRGSRLSTSAELRTHSQQEFDRALHAAPAGLKRKRDLRPDEAHRSELALCMGDEKGKGRSVLSACSRARASASAIATIAATTVGGEGSLPAIEGEVMAPPAVADTGYKRAIHEGSL